MSYCYLHGIAPISEGRKVQTVRSTGSAVWHAVYDSMIYLESGEQMDGVFRTFAPASESIYPSDTLMSVHCKFAIAPVSPERLGTVGPLEFVLESINHAAFVSDPQSEGYDSFMPVNNVPSISLLGNVVGSVVHLGDGGKAVDVKVSSYIQGKSVDCVYRCRFPATPRWSKVNMPVAGSVIAVLGRPHSLTGFSGTGMLTVTVEDIVYNPGTAHILDEPRSDLNGSVGRLRVRKRKLAALESSNIQDKDTGKVEEPNKVNGGASASGESGGFQAEVAADIGEAAMKGKAEVEKKGRVAKKPTSKAASVVQKSRGSQRKKQTELGEAAFEGELTDIEEETSGPVGVEPNGITA